jgi:hypothetical protein
MDPKDKSTVDAAAPAAVAPVITAPFTGLQAGKKYKYSRANWPAPQAGTKHEKNEHDAELKEFPTINSQGKIVQELRVQLDGVGRFFTLLELPADAIFKSVGLFIALLFLVGATFLSRPASAATTVQTNSYGTGAQQGYGLVIANALVITNVADAHSGTQLVSQVVVSGYKSVGVQVVSSNNAAFTSNTVVFIEKTIGGNYWIPLSTIVLPNGGTVTKNCISNYTIVGDVAWRLSISNALGVAAQTTTVSVIVNQATQ